MRISVGFFLLVASVLGIFGADVAPTTVSVVPSVKTTEVPQTSSSASLATTTTTKPTASTEDPVTTTSEAPTTTTTPVVTTKPTTEPPTTSEQPTEPPTTTTAVTPTESPTPAVGNWSVSHGNVTCIKAKMAVKISVKNLGPFANESISHNLSPDATSDKSTCNYNVNGTEQSLVLEDGDYVLTFIFAKDDEVDYVQNVSLSFTKDKEDVRHLDTKKLFAASKGNSYLCSKQEEVKFDNVTLAFTDVHIQAFGTTDSDEFRKAEECEADEDLNDTVPLIVAFTLCLTIVALIVAYLIGRRHARQHGYSTV